MKNIIDNNGVSYAINKKQMDLVMTLDRHKMIHILQSRQVGMTTLLLNYILDYIENNDAKIIIILMGKSIQAKDQLRKLREIFKHTNSSLTIVRDSSNELIFSNGCKVMARGAGVEGFRGYNVDFLYVDNMYEFFDGSYMPMIAHRLDFKLVYSGAMLEKPIYDAFVNPSNGWAKFTMHFTDMPKIWTIERIKTFMSALGDDRFKRDMSCDLDFWKEEFTPKVENKDVRIQLRIDKDLESGIIGKISERDITISQYLRELIKKDLNS